ncbi:MAG: hypothetical protein HKN16_07060 [Saprospiraceae bacterium]|nr:hypothetical protein [Saprospiraceae bacterium]
MVQNSIPSISTKNYAAPAYGTVHSLLQLKANFEAGEIPEYAILGYTSYHEARNQLSGNQQKYWRESFFPGETLARNAARFPYAKEEGSELQIDFLSLKDFRTRSKLSSYSVLFNRFENAISNIIYGFTDKYRLTESILVEIQNLCSANGVSFLLVCLDASESCENLEEFCQDIDIQFLNASLDITDPTYNLLPYDSHPNSKAHKFYGELISSYLLDSKHISKHNASQ